jgi:DNA-binding beta-propeller fold protein YncE
VLLARGSAPAVVLVVSLALAACDSGAGEPTGASSPAVPSATSPAASQPSAPPARPEPVPLRFRNLLPGMPPVQDDDVYSSARAGRVLDRIAAEPAYLYVPNSYGAPITTVIDQRTHEIVRILHTGEMSQHVTPSYDLSMLYVEASYGNSLVAIDPATGRIQRRIHVQRPYNLYFTPDGKAAIVMQEDDDRIVFTDPVRFRPERVIEDPDCRGPNHADFTANGRFLLVTCEFSGTILKVSTLRRAVVDRLDLPAGAKPQDVRLSPDGRSFFVADMDRNLLLEIPWNHLRVTASTPMPAMPHGIYPSRDGRFLYVSSRMAGVVSVFSLERRKIVDTWTIPGGGTPDMGGLSADGRILWLSGRTSGYVYGWDTRTGELIAKIRVGGSPHGLLVWPQPGRYSLGHTGNMR